MIIIILFEVTRSVARELTERRIRSCFVKIERNPTLDRLLQRRLIARRNSFDVRRPLKKVGLRRNTIGE